MNLQKPTKYILIFIATLGFVMFLSTAKSLAASISISANVQGYCWSVTGPANFVGCNDASGSVPGGQYSISLTSVPSGYSFSSLGGSDNPAQAGNISWVGTFTANPPPPQQPTVDAKANGSNGPITVAFGSTVTLTWTSTNATSCSSPALGSGLPANETGTGYQYTATSSGTSSITCTGPGGTSSPDSVTVNVGPAPTPTPTPDAPACNFNFSPSSINLGQSTAFHWTSNDADGQIPYSCTGNLGSGTLTSASGGPLTVVPNPTTNQTCSLTVHTSGSTKICGATITVSNPTVDLKCGGSDTSTTVPYGGSANISWTSGGVSNCTVSPSNWTGTSNSGISTGSLTSNRTYTITCQ